MNHARRGERGNYDCEKGFRYENSLLRGVSRIGRSLRDGILRDATVSRSETRAVASKLTNRLDGFLQVLAV